MIAQEVVGHAQQPRPRGLADRSHVTSSPPRRHEHCGRELLGVGPARGTPETVVVDAAGVAVEQHAEALMVAVDGKVPQLNVR